MKKIFKSRMIMWVSILALLVVAVGGTLALMFTRANPLTNIFTVGAVDTEIKEDLTAGKQVSITNHGTAPAYVRARILVSGVASENVKIVSTVPTEKELNGDTGKNTVYLVMPYTFDSDASWKRNTSDEDSKYTDDYYYYLDVLNPKEGDTLSSTTDLLTTVVLGSDLASKVDELDNFNVTIYHESVQAIGTPPETITAAYVETAFNNAGAGITEEAGSGAGGSTT